MSEYELWAYRADVWIDGRDVVGYTVDATDGEIGKIDETSLDADEQHIVVDTGFWIFGKRRLIPAAAVTRIDHDNERVQVDLTKEQVKAAPDFDDVQEAAEDRRRERLQAHEDYYARMGW